MDPMDDGVVLDLDEQNDALWENMAEVEEQIIREIDEIVEAVRGDVDAEMAELEEDPGMLDEGVGRIAANADDQAENPIDIDEQAGEVQGNVGGPRLEAGDGPPPNPLVVPEAANRLAEEMEQRAADVCERLERIAAVAPPREEADEVPLTPSGAEMKGVTCMICYDPYNTTGRIPKVFVCGHTFCLLCVGGLLKNRSLYSNGGVSCPTCRGNTKCPSADPTKIATNFGMLSMLEQRLEEARALANEQDMSPCSECKIVFVGTELTQLIGDPASEHAIHPRASLDKIKRYKANLICRECIESNHSRDNYVSFDKVAAIYAANQKIKECEKGLKKSLKHADDLLLLVEQTKHEILDHRRRMVNAIHNIRQEAHHPDIYEYLRRFKVNIRGSSKIFTKLGAVLNHFSTLSRARYYRTFGTDCLRPIVSTTDNNGVVKEIKREPSEEPTPLRETLNAYRRALGEAVRLQQDIMAPERHQELAALGPPLPAPLNALPRFRRRLQHDPVPIRPAEPVPPADDNAPVPIRPAEPVPPADDNAPVPIRPAEPVPPVDDNVPAVENAPDAALGEAPVAALGDAPVAALGDARVAALGDAPMVAENVAEAEVPPAAGNVPAADPAIPAAVAAPAAPAAPAPRVPRNVANAVGAALFAAVEAIPRERGAPLDPALPDDVAPWRARDAFPEAFPLDNPIGAILGPLEELVHNAEAINVVLAGNPVPHPGAEAIRLRAARPAGAPRHRDLFPPPPQRDWAFAARRRRAAGDGNPRELRRIRADLQEAMGANPILAEIPAVQNAIDALQAIRENDDPFGFGLDDPFGLNMDLAFGRDFGIGMGGLRRRRDPMAAIFGDDLNREAARMVRRRRRVAARAAWNDMPFDAPLPVVPAPVGVDPLLHLRDDIVVRADRLMDLVRNEAHAEAAIAGRPVLEPIAMPPLLMGLVHPFVQDFNDIMPQQVEDYHAALLVLEREWIQRHNERRARMPRPADAAAPVAPPEVPAAAAGVPIEQPQAEPIQQEEAAPPEEAPAQEEAREDPAVPEPVAIEHEEAPEEPGPAVREVPRRYPSPVPDEPAIKRGRRE